MSTAMSTANAKPVDLDDTMERLIKHGAECRDLANSKDEAFPHFTPWMKDSGRLQHPEYPPRLAEKTWDRSHDHMIYSMLGSVQTSKRGNTSINPDNSIHVDVGNLTALLGEAGTIRPDDDAATVADKEKKIAKLHNDLATHLEEDVPKRLRLYLVSGSLTGMQDHALLQESFAQHVADSIQEFGDRQDINNLSAQSRSQWKQFCVTRTINDAEKFYDKTALIPGDIPDSKTHEQIRSVPMQLQFSLNDLGSMKDDLTQLTNKKIARYGSKHLGAIPSHTASLLMKVQEHDPKILSREEQYTKEKKERLLALFAEKPDLTSEEWEKTDLLGMFSVKASSDSDDKRSAYPLEQIPSLHLWRPRDLSVERSFFPTKHTWKQLSESAKLEDTPSEAHRSEWQSLETERGKQIFP